MPDDVLAQLGSRVQHQLRAHTPNDAKALKATVNTYPTSAYDDLGEVITSLGIGEAVVTVMNERGAPTPVAWTRLRAPESLMGPADPAAMAGDRRRPARGTRSTPRRSTASRPARSSPPGSRRAPARQAEEDAAERGRQGRSRRQEGAEPPRTEKKDDGGWSATSSSPAPSRTSCAPPPARSPAGMFELRPPLTGGSGASSARESLDEVGQRVYAAQVVAGRHQPVSWVGVTEPEPVALGALDARGRRQAALGGGGVGAVVVHRRSVARRSSPAD